MASLYLYISGGIAQLTGNHDSLPYFGEMIAYSWEVEISRKLNKRGNYLENSGSHDFRAFTKYQLHLDLIPIYTKELYIIIVKFVYITPWCPANKLKW